MLSFVTYTGRTLKFYLAIWTISELAEIPGKTSRLVRIVFQHKYGHDDANMLENLSPEYYSMQILKRGIECVITT